MNDAFNHPQSVVVFGGTSDIAGAIVDRLVADRCRTVVLAGRSAASLHDAAARAKAGGADTVETVEFDALDLDRATQVVDAAFDAAGGEVDLVLITLGYLGTSEADALSVEPIAQTVTVNFTWPAVAVAASARRLRSQGRGRIVVLSSVAGVRVRKANFIYGSAKAGLDRYARAFDETLRESGVKVQVVRPGFVHSKMTEGLRPAPFAVDADTVARAVLRGIERDEPVIWVPAQLRWVFAVLRLLPQPLWRRMPG